MASTDELNQVAAATTVDQLDAIQAGSQDPAVLQAVVQRREEIGAITPAQRRAAVAATSTELGPNASTDRNTRQYFDVPNGDGTFRQVNAWGEEKGSAEDKKRSDKASSAA